jgi:nucleoside-diphosphate-sugar epimerase
VRLFLSGGSGLVGGAFLARLRPGVEVVALTRREPAPRPGVRWLAGDLTRPEGWSSALSGCAAVVHCAGIMGSDEENVLVNRDGTRTLLEAAERAGVARFVHVSSTAVYGDEGHHEIAEDAPRNGTSSYARSKIEAEDAVLAAGERGSLAAWVVRPCMISGPGDRSLAPAVRALLQRDEVLLPALGESRLDLVRAGDVAELISRMALEGAGSGAYHAASGAPRTLRAILESAARAVGARPRWRPLPLAAAREELMARARAGGLTPVDGALFSIAACERTYSIARARRELGFEPAPGCPLAEALQAR